MKIIIEYENKWGNSFLSEPSKNGARNYIASQSALKKNENYKEKDISLTTVLGILYRLIGCRKPIDKLSLNEKYFDKYISNNKLTFNNKIITEYNEIVYLRNANNSNDQNSFSGVPDDSIMECKDIQKLFNIIIFNREQLINYILNDIYPNIEINKIELIDFVDLIDKKHKSEKIKEEILLNEINIKLKKMNSNFDFVLDSSLYLIAINKMTILLFSDENFEKYSKFLTKNKTFAGITFSNGKSFTKKDFMSKFSAVKIQYGNPYIAEIWVENVNSKENKKMKINKNLNKKNGILEINIDCNEEEGYKIQELIENAGVSSFYIGKKGLAYITKIEV